MHLSRHNNFENPLVDTTIYEKAIIYSQQKDGMILAYIMKMTNNKFLSSEFGRSLEVKNTKFVRWDCKITYNDLPNPPLVPVDLQKEHVLEGSQASIRPAKLVTNQ